MKKRDAFIFIAAITFAYYLGVVSSDPQRMILNKLRMIRSQLMGYDSILPNTFLMTTLIRMHPRNQLFEVFAPKVDVVMIGDSLTEGVIWSEVFPNIRIANRGVSGDRTIDILNRIDVILNLQPKKVFILAGLNDFASGANVDQAFETYVKILKRLREKNIEVYVQSTIECSRIRCGNQDDEVQALNVKLQKYAKEEHLVFIDLNNKLSSKRLGLLPRYTSDGIHLTADGYVVWSQMIMPYLL